MAGGEKSFDFAVDRLETYKGREVFTTCERSPRGGTTSAGSHILLRFA